MKLALILAIMGSASATAFNIHALPSEIAAECQNDADEQVCLIALTASECTAELNVMGPPVSHACKDIALGAICEGGNGGDNQCGTSGSLNNCGGNDLYKRVKCPEKVFVEGDAPKCGTTSSGDTIVYYTDKLTSHSSFKCHKANCGPGGNGLCEITHPTHHFGGCRQFVHANDEVFQLSGANTCNDEGLSDVDCEESESVGSCVGMCGTGTKTTTRTVLKPQRGAGAACLGTTTASCDTGVPCNQDCDETVSYGTCVKESGCGSGTQTVTFTTNTPALGTGTPCSTDTTQTCGSSNSYSEVSYDGSGSMGPYSTRWFSNPFGHTGGYSNMWEVSHGVTGKYWLKYSFGSPKAVTKAVMWQYQRSCTAVGSGCCASRKTVSKYGKTVSNFCENDGADRHAGSSGAYCNKIQIQYSSDNSNWSTASTWPAQISENTFTWDSVGAYRYWRLFCDDDVYGGGNPNQWQGGSIRLYQGGC